MWLLFLETGASRRADCSGSAFQWPIKHAGLFQWPIKHAGLSYFLVPIEIYVIIKLKTLINEGIINSILNTNLNESMDIKEKLILF